MILASKIPIHGSIRPDPPIDIAQLADIPRLAHNDQLARLFRWGFSGL